MGKTTDVHLVAASAQTEHFDYRMPIKFGGRVLSEVLLFHVTVQVETRLGRRGEGFGSMPMGNIWAWPSNQATPDQTLQAMTALAQRMVERAGEYVEYGHPLEITHELNRLSLQTEAEAVCQELQTPEPMPRLAQLVAASPLEAAIHDAYGKALGANSYDLLGPEFVNRDLSFYLDKSFAGEYLDRYTLRAPKPTMPLYHLIGALDPLTPQDVQTRPDDGLPVTLDEWILYDGLTHLKIKLNGDDLAWDVDRVVSVERVAAEAQRRRGCTEWFYSADFNERCQSVEYVLDWLAEVGRRAPEALDRLQYIEQPTHRDLAAHPENKMHRAAAIKPVVIDESLVDYPSLLLAREQGYSGVALKTCKGHSEALLMGAAAQKFAMFLCVQDLTCPGYSFLHSASLAARVPTVAAIEGNARQYCPDANAAWAQRYPEMFHPSDGSLPTGLLASLGLGMEPI